MYENINVKIMSKKTREQKRAEEKRIIAEMEEALQGKASLVEESAESNKTKQTNFYGEDLPEVLHCKRCKTKMEKGVCPVCGFKVYVPLRKEKRDKIRAVIATVSMVIFIILFLLSQIKNS